MDRLRHWLEKNKIFFEVFTSLFLGVGGIALAIGSFIVSKNSLELTRAQNYPSLILVSDRPLIDGKRSDEILIVNSGGYARNLSIQFESVLNVLTNNPSEGNCIYLNGYFDDVVFENTRKEVVARIRRKEPGNYIELSRLDPESLAGFPNLYTNISVTTLVRIDYLRLGGDSETVYFSFNYGRGKPSMHISNDEYRAGRAKCGKNFKSIGKLSPNDLNKLVI